MRNYLLQKASHGCSSGVISVHLCLSFSLARGAFSENRNALTENSRAGFLAFRVALRVAFLVLLVVFPSVRATPSFSTEKCNGASLLQDRPKEVGRRVM